MRASSRSCAAPCTTTSKPVLRLGVRVRRADAELVLAALLELAPDGLEETDVDPHTVEYALYGSDDELPADGALRELTGDSLVALVRADVADDWAERWRGFHRPLVLGDRLCVRPPWEPARATALDVVIDPGQAFGTGAHATTRLCLELLLGLRPVADATGRGVVDLGCGSGVLAITAAKLGRGPVLALDNDPLAVQATLANAAVNGVADLVAAGCFDLLAETVPPADLLLGNLLGPLLLVLADGLADRPRHGAIIASGLLDSEADEVSRRFARGGYRERRRLTREGWSALLLEAPQAGRDPTIG